MNTIAFDIAGAGAVHTIAPRSPLPQLTHPAVIDGSTQPGYAGAPLIEVDGSGAGPNADGISAGLGGGITVRAGHQPLQPPRPFPQRRGEPR